MNEREEAAKQANHLASFLPEGSFKTNLREHARKLTDTEAGPKACVLCGTQPQAIGLHCNNCWNDLADQDPLMWLPE